MTHGHSERASAVRAGHCERVSALVAEQYVLANRRLLCVWQQDYAAGRGYNVHDTGRNLLTRCADVLRPVQLYRARQRKRHITYVCWLDYVPGKRGGVCWHLRFLSCCVAVDHTFLIFAFECRNSFVVVLLPHCKFVCVLNKALCLKQGAVQQSLRGLAC